MKAIRVEVLNPDNRYECRSQWQRGLSCGSAAVRLLGLWVRIPPGEWMSVSCECCVLSGKGLCVGLITRPEESYRVWCVWVWWWSLDKWGPGPLGAVAPWKKNRCEWSAPRCGPLLPRKQSRYSLNKKLCGTRQPAPGWNRTKILQMPNP
jgi:hypothetical protein